MIKTKTMTFWAIIFPTDGSVQYVPFLYGSREEARDSNRDLKPTGIVRKVKITILEK